MLSGQSALNSQITGFLSNTEPCSTAKIEGSFCRDRFESVRYRRSLLLHSKIHWSPVVMASVKAAPSQISK